MSRVNYDQLALEYDQRYAAQELADRGRALLELAERPGAGPVLEAGCGTAHWLAALRPAAGRLFGLDLFAGMLRQARKRSAPANLVQGSAIRLPFRDRSFHLVYCVDAIHHFGEPKAYIREALRVLRPAGVLAVIGSDPHSGQDNWYVYDYFDGIYAADLQRFPAHGALAGWMGEEGFENIQVREVERIDDPKHGRAVLGDPFLRKNSCSQLALLSDAAYRAGVEKIEQAVAEAEARGETLLFRSELSIQMITGYKPR